MADAWLIIVTVITAVLMLAITIYVFYLYCHPDDNTYAAGWIAKGIVILAIAVIWGFVMLLPLDVANSRGVGGGLNMDIAYQVLFIIFFVMIAAVLPFTLFLYETDEDKPIPARICWAFWYQLFLSIGILILALIAYFALRKAQVANMYYADVSQLKLTETADIIFTSKDLGLRVTYDLPPYLFMCVFLIFVGWIFFVVFGAIGLVALPFDMILDYFYRPRPRTALEMAEKKVALKRRCQELLSYSRKVEELSGEVEEQPTGFFARWKNNRKISSKEGKLQKELYLLENEIEVYELESKLKANPVWSLIKMIIGCLLGVISFIIWLHLLIYKIIIINGRPASMFLNDMMFWLEFSIARFVSTIVFAAIGIYLIFCVIKGTIKFGLRLFFIIKIHPMKLHRTYMNSFLFNTILIMLATVGSIHFIILLFQHYMRLTSGTVIFATLLTKLRVLKFFWEWKVFLYAFLIFTVITFIYLLVRPKTDRMDVRAMIERRKNAK